MSKAKSGGNPPLATRFVKGQSGNPKGRPRKNRPATSPFDVLLNTTMTVTRGGIERDFTVEEALQHRILAQALEGNRSARREVLKWIEKRDKVAAAKARRKPVRIPRRIEPVDPKNADEVLLLLGIASHDRARQYPSQRKYLLLEPWAVQLAVSRRRMWRLRAEEVSEIKRCTRQSETLRWPRGLQDETDE
jgi:hypothetical protein